MVYKKRLEEFNSVSEAFKGTQRHSVNSVLKITRLNIVHKERKLLSMSVHYVLLYCKRVKK